MKRLPLLAIVLGLGGLIPFVGLAVAILFAGTLGPVPRLGMAMLTYGGAILSFLGAVHWGLALEPPAIMSGSGTQKLDRQRLLWGVVPSLWAWLALYAGVVWHVRAGLALEIAGFLATIAVERAAYRRGALPPGYMMLRLVLTTVAVLCLGAALLMPLENYAI
ncbi:hypothetical protein AA101099_3067 [Neoasaia chiangmaiensis NBRC 101099]|uniref:Uncharacterized protein n=1 Tax=Neoasaia chiangmaiensis TaxID=320497 RepID=A0A1U9KNH1_9PROT|nr:DUF3429 domain-containing protein [Neoasaia chiangmaiensis]AQS87352.1 hypothetical protein A0U93_04705 [Neoasaia chiangmaiensis]GBR43021.1 hypothetical protein AA101099_3067 [Neoasaia chiangmaiensis NBRC 101099]GEN16111.1 hypothetical protein NCH01_25420 [Neoasaia chiangmaiensis]